MNNDKAATLYVSDVEEKGWTPTKGSDKQPYWYLFDGGEGGGEFHGKGHEKAVEFVVTLDADKEFRMHDVQFKDGEGQLEYVRKKSNHQRCVIADANTGFLEAYYLVVVSREKADRVIEIPCDPMIKNDPKAF
jgi:hypothetical protein